MKNSTTWTAGILLLLTLCVAPLAVAQDDPFAIDGDVDRDGMVGPTDIQHVINGALGLNDQGPEAINRALRQYIVASPRASLAPRPGTTGSPDERCSVVGAATNFQRDNGRLLVRAGTGILFRYDRNVEGVWYDNACGLLRSELVVEMRPIEPDTEPSDNTNGAEPAEWSLVGRDGAAARTCGPVVATANIGVRSRFPVAGDFLVRCTIRTFAIPEGEVARTGEATDFCGAARDVDIVLTHVRVVDRDATNRDIDWEVDENSPTVGSRFGDMLENGEWEDVELP